MTITHNEFDISDDYERLDFERIHAWLAATYWSPGIAREKVERAATNSALVIGAYHGDIQVGYLRVISDRTTFGYLADVYVDPGHRRRGLASAMVNFSLDHPDYQTLRNWLLITADAQDVYRSCGFDLFPHPERIMNFRPGDLRKTPHTEP